MTHLTGFVFFFFCMRFPVSGYYSRAKAVTWGSNPVETFWRISSLCFTLPSFHSHKCLKKFSSAFILTQFSFIFSSVVLAIVLWTPLIVMIYFDFMWIWIQNTIWLNFPPLFQGLYFTRYICDIYEWLSIKFSKTTYFKRLFGEFPPL